MKRPDNAKEGITFQSSEKTDKKLVIINEDVLSKLPTVSAGECAKVLSAYTDKDGNKAVVPEGWTVSGAPSENVIFGKDMGLVIYHIPEKQAKGVKWRNKAEVETIMEVYDQFVWTPVGLLSATGTLDGVHFNEKFGRMDYRGEKFSENNYHEPIDGELALQKKSVDKYEGYYSTRYKISRDENTGKPRSVKNAYPLRQINLPTGKMIAASMVQSKTVKSHLMYGAEYDTREKWVIETGAVSQQEIAEDSTNLGNYYNNKNYSHAIVKTGEDGCVNNIYGFTGNIEEWTQEQMGCLLCVTRGGNRNNFGSICPADYRNLHDPSYWLNDIGIRATLYIE